MIALVAARLFDGRSPRLIERPMVLIDNGAIVAVQPRATPPPGCAVVDLGEVTLMPGLIDTHMHLGFDASDAPAAHMASEADEALLLRMRMNAVHALVAGITSVRDLGDRAFLGVALRNWFRDGPELGPAVVAAGPPLTCRNGHCHFMGGEVVGPATLGGAAKVWVERGVDIVKVMVTGGLLTSGSDPLTPQFTQEEVAIVVRAAHRLHRKVTAHAHGAAGVELAVSAGVDGLEHAKFWTEDGIRADQRVIDEIAARGIWVCPTLGRLPHSSPPPPAVAARDEAAMRVVGRMHAAGVRLVAGTDGGISPAKPHHVLPYAVEDLAEAGLSNFEALRSATSAAAEVCDLTTKGVLAPGLDADLIAVEGNPLVDLGALHRVRAVFRAGVRVL